MAQQGPPPPSSSRPSASRSRRSWQDDEIGDEEEYPPWAGLGVIPRYADHERRERQRLGAPAEADRAAGDRGREGQTRERRADGDATAARGRPRPPRGGRAAAGRIRRVRRAIWGGAVAIVVVVVAAVAVGLLLTSHHQAPDTNGGLVTSFLPGEAKTVPSACSAVSTATLNKYLPGRRHVVRPHSLAGAAQSLCDWSLGDRWLNVTLQAYAPSGLAQGDGSATNAAIGAYQQALANLAHPPKSTHLPKATVTTLRGLGQVAFAAAQAPSAGGATTEILTVVTREQNVLVTVVFEATASGQAAPVPTAQLRAGAIAAARDILAGLR